MHVDTFILSCRDVQYKLMVVPRGTTRTSKACSKTVSRRNQVLGHKREVVSGSDSSTQLQSEVQKMIREERQKLLQGAGISVEIPPDASVAMKAALGPP